MNFFNIIKFHASSQPDPFVLKIFIRPFPSIATPAVLWTFRAYSKSLAWGVGTDIQNAVFYPQSLYRLSLGATEYTSIASILGIVSVVLLAVSSPIKIAHRSAHRNNVIREPEQLSPRSYPGCYRFSDRLYCLGYYIR